MKKHISLLVAAVMVLTLIYTPAGLVYGAEEEGPQADSPVAAEPAEENAEEPAEENAEEPAEENAEEPATEEQEPVADPEKNAGTPAEGDSSNNEPAVEEVTGNETLGDVQAEEGEDTVVLLADEATFEVTVTKPYATSIVLSWNDYETAEQYKVFNGETEITTVPRGTNTATITGLTPNTKYTFNVRACDGDGNELARADVTTSTTYAAIENLKALHEKATAKAVVLTWSATKGAGSYKVFNGATKVSATIKKSQGTFTATVSGLTPNTKYTFTVKAYAEDGTEFAKAKVTTSTTKAAIKNLKALHKKATEKTVVLTWSATEGAGSYKVFKGKTKVSATIKKSKGTITATVSGLSARKDYSFTVKAYNQDGKEFAKGTVKAYTCPKNPLPTVKVTKSFPNYVVSWAKKKDVVGYEFRYSTKKNKGTIKKLGKSTLKKTVTKLKNGKTYYFQVRVKYQYKDGPVVKSGWKTVSKKVATTGWKTVVKKGKKNGKKYYYVNGVMQKNKEFWLGKLKYFVDKNGVWRGGSKYMWNRCKNETSGTDTMLVTSRNRHTVCIFKKVDGTWCCQYEWLCSVGKKGSRTPHGKFYVRNKKKSFGKGHTCWYATRYHKKYPKAAFHSVLYKTGSKTKIKDGRLGKDVSNGCVRLSLKWAKWIYDNVKKRSRIYIY